MHPLFLARLLWYRRVLAGRNRWTRAELEEHQTGAFAGLRAHALAKSSFYRGFHRGLENAPLAALPVLTKAALMENFDAIATDPRVDRESAEAHLGDPSASHRYLGRYVLSATSGTTGRKGIFLHDPSEWAWVVASYARSGAWAGIRAGLARPVRMAMVGTRTRWHQSALIGSSLEGRIVPSLRLDATDTLESMVRALNAFHPGSLSGYPSVLRRLAEEQIAGRLRIRPQAVLPAAEVLTQEDRSLLLKAWGSEPFNVYGATETGCIASECSRHRGLHLHEDQVLVENVDEGNRPVPAGEFGAKLLVTVLFSRTLPLIRYEITDSVRMTGERCACGVAFGLIDGIQGRTVDILRLAGEHGAVDIHPNVLHNRLGPVPAREWQVVKAGSDSLRVLVAGLRPSFDLGAVMSRLETDIKDRGGNVSITWESVDSIPRGPNGKAALFKGFA